MRLAMGRSRIDGHLHQSLLPDNFTQLRLYGHRRRIITHDQLLYDVLGALSDRFSTRRHCVEEFVNLPATEWTLPCVDCS
jgi:hypothetical protein